METYAHKAQDGDLGYKMEIPRFHRPRWSDVCDECDGECVCGNQAIFAQGSECCQHREEVIKLLKVLGIEKPQQFMGIFQQEHKACPRCTKYIYDHLKKENARRSLTRPKPAQKSSAHLALQDTAKTRPRMNSSESEDTASQSTCIELDKELSKLNASSSADPHNGSSDQLVSAARWLDGESSALAILDKPCSETSPQKPGRRFDKTSTQRSQRQQGENKGKNVPPPQMVNKDATMMGGPMQQMGGNGTGMMGNPMMGGPHTMMQQQMLAMMMQQQMMANMQQWDAWLKVQSGMVPGGPPGYFNKGA